MSTVRAVVDTVEGTRMVADVPVMRTVALFCGCTRYEGIRPGADPDRRPVARVHILSGCRIHPDERWPGAGRELTDEDRAGGAA